MLKPRMECTGIDQVRQPKLFDPPEPLEIRVLDDPEGSFARDADESVNRVVDYFAFMWPCLLQIIDVILYLLIPLGD
jgi:hypothetical protein